MIFVFKEIEEIKFYTLWCIIWKKAHPFYIYRVYQKEVNSPKSDSKLKNMKYLVKILS